jgi:hypothetical protein
VDPAKERRLIVLALKRMGGPLTGFIASRLPLNVGVETFRVPGSEQAIATEILRVAASMGDVIEAEPPELSWVGRGLARNPAVVTVTLKPIGSEVEVTVRAAAAEGLLKQRTGEKTATAVAERLQHGAG